MADCEHEDRWFDRSICHCGRMHYFCNDCGAQIDACTEADRD